MTKDQNGNMGIIIKIGAGVQCKDLPVPVSKKIEKDLSFPNPAYVTALKRGSFIPADMPAKVVLWDYEEETDTTWIPRGYVFWLLKFIKLRKYEYTIQDHTLLFKPLDLKFLGKLKPYQNKANKHMMEYPVGVLEGGTGSGKTVVGISLIVSRQQPTLIIVHSKELLYQWQKEIKKFTGYESGLVGDGKFTIKSITVGIINSVNNKLDQLTEHFGQIVIDECFVKGTLIDGIPIEQIKEGDYVNSFNHNTNSVERKRVLKLYKNPVKDILVEIKLKNGKSFICTPDHPIFDGKKYLTASSFNDRCTMLSIDNQLIGEENGKEKSSSGKVCSVPKSNSLRKQRRGSYLQKSGSIQKEKTPLLLEMQRCDNEKSKTEIRKMAKPVQQKTRQQKNERKQSYEEPQEYRENEICEKSKRNSTHLSAESRREWEIYTPAGKICSSSGVGYGGCNKNSRSFTKRPTKNMVIQEINAYLLQSRCRELSIENSNRNRRKGNSCRAKKEIRQKERTLFNMEGVESVTIHKRGGGPRFREVCPDGFVYNIEVETNHNYFVENTLVHNCHRISAETWAHTLQEFSAKHYLGLTATAYRRDKLGHAIFASIGPKIHTIDKKMLYDTKAILRPDVYHINSSFYFLFKNDYSTMIKELTQDKDRNTLICKEIARDLKVHKENIVVVSDRKNHCVLMQKMLLKNHGVDSRVLTGGSNQKHRKETIEQIKSGKCKVVFATLSLIGEGFDAPNLTALFITTPIKFMGRLVQVCGRVLRSKKNKKPRIYDVRDDNIKILQYSGYNRDKIYKKEWS